MRRIETIDGLRGYFLVFMFINHLTFTGGYMLKYFNHAQLGFVEDAQGFVFLSGLLAGMVYTRRMAREGFAFGAKALWRRSGELYAYTIACIVTVLLLREALPDAAQIWRPWLGEIGRGGAGVHLGAAAMLYQATYLDILPQYIVYMLIAPGVIWLVLNGRAAAVIAGSLVLWLCVQTGLHLPLADTINAGLKHVSPKLQLRVPFNVLAWQLLFMSAMVIGVLMAQNKLDIGRFFDPRKPTVAKMFAFSLLFFLCFRLAFTFDLVPGDVATRFRMLEHRSEFSVIFLVDFVLAAYVMAWMLVAGPHSENLSIRRLAGVLTGLFNLSFLRLLGRHSLQIYAWHVVLVYAILWFDKYAGPFDQLTKSAIAIGGIAVLSFPAIYRERRSASRTARSAATGARQAPPAR